MTRCNWCQGMESDGRFSEVEAQERYNLTGWCHSLRWLSVTDAGGWATEGPPPPPAPDFCPKPGCDTSNKVKLADGVGDGNNENDTSNNNSSSNSNNNQPTLPPTHKVRRALLLMLRCHWVKFAVGPPPPRSNKIWFFESAWATLSKILDASLVKNTTSLTADQLRCTHQSFWLRLQHGRAAWTQTGALVGVQVSLTKLLDPRFSFYKSKRISVFHKSPQGKRGEHKNNLDAKLGDKAHCRQWDNLKVSHLSGGKQLRHWQALLLKISIYHWYQFNLSSLY